MNCIIVDDEPLAREAIEYLLKETPQVQLIGMFNNATATSQFMQNNDVDLVFLDINMPRVSGLDFARTISPKTLVIFTTAYSEYAIDSYDVDAIGFLLKPIETDKFVKAVNKAISYHNLLKGENKESIEGVEETFFFVKSERRYFKIFFEEILFVEGLKDYVIIHTSTQRVVTRMNLKSITSLLPLKDFFRINKSYIVNLRHITSFNNNDIFINDNEIAIGINYRDDFYEKFVGKNIK